MPRELSNTDYQIWENINHVGLWGILWARIIIRLFIIRLTHVNVRMRVNGETLQLHAVFIKAVFFTTNLARTRISTANHKKICIR